ncbi:MAG: mannosyltransferase family protein [Candidatus Limnocylindrales bacterium]
MAESGAQWRTWDRYRGPFAIALGSRLFSVILVLGSSGLLPHRPTGVIQTGPFAIFDGSWYLSIAQNGYHASPLLPFAAGGYHDFAFFPMWPLLIRLASAWAILPTETVAVVVANALFVLAALLIFRLFERSVGRDLAVGGLVLLSFSPAAYVFSLAYSESLFLLIAAIFFTVSERCRWIPVMFAQLTRLSGFALVATTFVDIRATPTRRAGLVTLVSGVAGFAIWWVFVALLTGDPLGYMRGIPLWYVNQVTGGPGQPTGVQSLLTAPYGLGFLIAALLALLLGAGFRLMRRGETRWGLYVLVCVSSTMLEAWDSMPRLAVVAFPAFASVAAMVPAGWRRRALFTCFAVGQVMLVWVTSSGQVAP